MKNDELLFIALGKIAVKIENDVRGELARQKHNASGGLSNSIEVIPVRYSKSEIGLEVRGAHYGKFIESGRGPTQGGTSADIPLRIRLIDWIKEKQGLGAFRDVTDKQIKGLAYVIARKIHKSGTKATRENDETKLRFIQKSAFRNIDYISSRLLKATGDKMKLDLYSVLADKRGRAGLDIELTI